MASSNSRTHTGIREEVRASLRSAGLLKIEEGVLSKCRSFVTPWLCTVNVLQLRDVNY
jgi:hypothetical protein